MGHFEEDVVLQNSQGKIVGKVLLIENNGFGRTVITADLNIDPGTEGSEQAFEKLYPADSNRIFVALWKAGLSFDEGQSIIEEFLNDGLVVRSLRP